MAAIFGTRLFGVTDEVPGLFHVATKFVHINFLPLFPLGSYLILQRGSGSARGFEIPLSGKSIAIAWIRAIGVISVLSTGIWSILIRSDEGLSASFGIAFGSLLVATLIASLLMWHGYTRNASYERASELASKLGGTAGPVYQRLVDAHFEQVGEVAVPTEDGDELVPSLEISSDLEFAEHKGEKDQKEHKQSKPHVKQSNVETSKLPDIV